ncbi:MAG TPA: hypothetical protein VN758_14810 [Solirubrobacterales bacterium]|nr:hypothetical protein [Solirubrobacterales bacterium]
MKQIRQRLTYANVVSTLALILVVGGASAIAARKVPKHSVGPHQLKSNAVTTPKIKANAVTTRKIKKNAITAVKIKDKAIKGEKLDDNAVTTAKIADGSVTGAKIDAATMPFGRIVQEARGSSTKALPDATLTVYPLPASTYTQPAGRDDTYIGQIEVVIPESCTGTRKITAGLLVDPADPTAPTSKEFVASREFQDTSTDPLTVRLSIGPAASFQPAKATTHSLYLAAIASCESGSGVTATSGGIDVIGTE